MKPWLIRRKIVGWFRRNNTLMAQAKELARQLQEAWDKVATLRDVNEIVAQERDNWKDAYYERDRAYNNIVEQLHRVARERDECYRQKRLSDMRHANTIREMQSAIDEMLDTIENEEE